MILEQMHQESTDTEFLLTELKRFVGIRNQMGGALYWNIIHDDCLALARRCMQLGADRKEIAEILG